MMTPQTSALERILRGPHQDAVAWKDLAEKVLYGGSGVPNGGTLRHLLGKLNDKREMLKRLT